MQRECQSFPYLQNTVLPIEPEANDVEMQLPIAIFVLILSLVVHESAHAWAALQLGDDTAYHLGRISLNPMVHLDPIGSVFVPVMMALLPGGMMIGWAKPVPVNTRRLGRPVRDHALVAAAGPASNLLLAFLSAILLGLVTGWAHAHPGSTQSELLPFLALLFEMGIAINILLALFNLIPLPPLDGSWIMMAFLRGEAAEAYARLRPFGFVIVLLLLNFGLGGVLRSAMGVVGQFYYQIVYQVGSLMA